jgi:hypothetical protein
MQPSTSNQLNLADIQNAVIHAAITVLAGAVGAVLQGIMAGQIIDWTTFKSAFGIAILNGLMVLYKRYKQNNVTEETAGQTQAQ